jgi:large-conductance mechanosensitive channel
VEPTNSKFLVAFFSKVNQLHVFILVWVLIVGFFVFLMVNYYRRTFHRNFRSDSGQPGAKDLVLLKDSKKNLEKKS